MENNKRPLTEPYEPASNPFTDEHDELNDDEEISSYSNQKDNIIIDNRNNVIAPPVLNIFPPDSPIDISNQAALGVVSHQVQDICSDDQVLAEHELDNESINSTRRIESKMAKLFRPQPPEHKAKDDKIGLKRPKLSLKTAPFGAVGKLVDSLSPTNIQNDYDVDAESSKKSYLRRRSLSSGDNKRHSKSISIDMAPRSAKVLSFIDPDDMSDFQDIQKGFQSAIDDRGFTWLHQPNKDTGSSLHSTTPTQRRRSNEQVQEDSGLGLFGLHLHHITPEIGPSQAFSTHEEPQLADEAADDYKLDTTKDQEFIETTEILDRVDSNDVHHVPIADFGPKSDRKPVKLYGRSLGILSNKNKLRVKLANIHVHPKFKFCHNVMLVLLTCFLSIRTYDTTKTDFLYHFSEWTDYIIFILMILFSIHDVTKALAFGFWDDSQIFESQRNYVTIVERLGIFRIYQMLRLKYNTTIFDFLIPRSLRDSIDDRILDKSSKSLVTDLAQNDDNDKYEIPRAFARSSWNRIDLVSTVSFWIGLFLSIRDYDERNGIRIFKTMSVLRILRLVNTDTGISSILRGIKTGMPQLINVSSMLVYFWVFFGILGVQVFKGSLRRQCVWINPDDPSDTYKYDMQFCGGYLDSTNGTKRKYIFSNGIEGPLSKGFLCPVNSKCISEENPYNNRISFDNIANSMQLVFVIMSANTFTDIMYYMMDSDEMAACLFFIVSIFVLTVWMMNLLVAVLVSSFHIAHEDFKKRKLDGNGEESFIIRLAIGYWRYFKVKALGSQLPSWATKGIRLYEKTEPAFILIICMDLICRALLTDKSSEAFVNRLMKIDQAFTVVLFIESAVRIILYSPNLWKFLIKGNYVYDAIIAIITLIITYLASHGLLGHTYYWLAIFHISRFYRVLMFFKFSRNLWMSVLGNKLMIWNLSAFYFFFTYLVSIILSITFEGIVPKDEMDNQFLAMYSLPNSFISLFTIGSTENWTDIMYIIQQYSPNTSSAFFCGVIFIIWFVLSYSVILNIFIALISESLEVKEEDKRPSQIKHYLKYIYPRKIQQYRHASLVSRLRKRFFKGYHQEDSRDFKQFLIRGTAILNIAQNMGDIAEDFNDFNTKTRFNKLLTQLVIKYPKFQFIKSYTENPFYSNTEVRFSEGEDENSKTYLLELNDYEEEKLVYLREHPYFNNSYFLFPAHHPLRKFCQRLVPPSVGKRTNGYRFYDDETDFYGGSRYFRHIERDIFVFIYAVFTILLVIFSCYVTPLFRIKHHMGKWNWMSSMDCAFVAAFTTEFIVKTIADGFIYSPNAYIRNPWNIVDFCVLISMWINLIVYLRDDSNLSRGLTALRALRCLTISDTARRTFNLVFFDGIGKIFEAAFVSVTLLFAYAVWGLGLFRGRLGTCNDGNMSRSECTNEFLNQVFKWDVLTPRVYQQPYLYLDSFASAFNSLYQIISLEGWVDLLENLMNSTGAGTVASTGATTKNAVYLISFNFLSMVFILNLFVSFIVNNQARVTGNAYFTTEEKSWLESCKLLTQAKPKAMPSLMEISGSRQFFYKLAVEKSNLLYATFLQLILYLHIVMLLSRTYTLSEKTAYQNVFFMISIIILLAQELFRLYGESFRIYIRNRWNIFRFTVLSVSFPLTVIGFTIPNTHVWYHNVSEFFHLLVFLFVIPQNDTLSELLETAMASLPPIISLVYTWGILFLVYAIALNQTFGLTRLGPNTTGNINFRTIWKTLVVLFRCSFGEGWNYIMDDYTRKKPFCSTLDGSGNYSDCGSRTYAYGLMMSWNILSMYIFVNMFISLIIGNFSYVYRKGGTDSTISRHEITKFIESWSKYDSDGTGELDYSYLPRIMHSLDGPLTFRIWRGRLSIKNLVKNFMDVNPLDPYDVKVDIQGLNEELSMINKSKVLQIKKQYRRFVQHIRHTDTQNGAMRFSTLITTLPLYTTYNPQECLGIDEYVHYLYVLGKVDKYLDNERNVDVLDMVVTRWKYKLRLHSAQNVFVSGVISDEQGSTLGLRLNSSNHRRVIEGEGSATPSMDYSVNNFLWSPKPPQGQ